MSVELEKGLHAILSGATTAETRVYSRIQQGAKVPAIRYQRISTTRNHSLDAAVGVTEAGIQLDCLDDTYLGAKTLADEVRVLLHAYRGAWGTLTAHLVSLETENDFYEEDGDWVRHWVSQRYQVYTDMD